MIAGSYLLHLYCRHAPESDQPLAKPGEFDARHYGGPAEFGNENTEADAKRSARKKGWKFSGGDVTCPTCAKNGPGTEASA